MTHIFTGVFHFETKIIKNPSLAAVVHLNLAGISSGRSFGNVGPFRMLDRSSENQTSAIPGLLQTVKKSFQKERTVTAT